VDLLALKTFVAVVEEGGVLAASKTLFTVQSNVTSRIKRLEQQLGAELFIRHGRGLQLTPAGNVLLEYARKMLKLAKQTESALQQVGENAGEIRIGAMETFAAVRLPAALKAIRQRHPGLKPQVNTNPTTDLVRQVLDHQLDCAFVGGPLEHPELVSEVVVTEKLTLVRGFDVDPDNQPLIMFREGCAYRARALAWRRQSGDPMCEVMQLGTLDGILGCVAVGLGATVLPEAVVRLSRFRDELITEEIPDDIALIDTLMIRHRDAPVMAGVNSLAEAVTETATIAAAA